MPSMSKMASSSGFIRQDAENCIPVLMEAPSSIAAETESTIAALKVNEPSGLSHVDTSEERRTAKAVIDHREQYDEHCYVFLGPTTVAANRTTEPSSPKYSMGFIGAPHIAHDINHQS